MSELVFFLEEPSVQAMLEGLLPQLLQGEVLVRYISNAAEQLEKITNGHYQKISGSRAIGPLLDPDNTRSPSFAAFIQGLRRLLSHPESAT